MPKEFRRRAFSWSQRRSPQRAPTTQQVNGTPAGKYFLDAKLVNLWKAHRHKHKTAKSFAEFSAKTIGSIRTNQARLRLLIKAGIIKLPAKKTGSDLRKAVVKELKKKKKYKNKQFAIYEIKEAIGSGTRDEIDSIIKQLLTENKVSIDQIATNKLSNSLLRKNFPRKK
jgi:undecaprenyl pyrophosphate synthase